MGIGNSKNIDSTIFNENIITEDCESINVKTENIDIKKNDDFIRIENNSYYTNSFDDFDNKFNNHYISDSLDELDIEGIFASYKVEFGTKSKTRHIIEKFNNEK